MVAGSLEKWKHQIGQHGPGGYFFLRCNILLPVAVTVFATT